MGPNTGDKCKNCGGDRGIHHYQTDQCPVGGREAPVNRKEEWKTTVFEIQTDDVENLRVENKVLRDALEKIHDVSVDEQGEWHGVTETHSPEYTHALKKIEAIADEAITSIVVKADAKD